MLPDLDEILADARVISLPLVTPFRGVTYREAMLLKGPLGWAEFSPFLEYSDIESTRWLSSALEAGWAPGITPLRETIPVNATLPTIPTHQIDKFLSRFGTIRTVKIKVANPLESLADDVARVREVRNFLGTGGRIRVDANGGWNVAEAEKAAHVLAEFDLEYLEQPCASIPELLQLREKTRDLHLAIAADESVRKLEDPLLVARSGAADLLVLKVQPLGGVRAALDIANRAGLPVVVSSALETSVGLAAGVQFAASLPRLEYDCGLGTATLLKADVSYQPLLPEHGQIRVRRIVPVPKLLATHAATPERTSWWHKRLRRCHRLLRENAYSPE